MKILLAIGSFFITSLNPASSTDEYKVVKRDNIVTLYERWIDIGSEDKVRELKADFEVRSTIPKLVSLLQNQQQGAKWTLHAKQYKISSTTQSNQWINYVKYAMPWPYDDQDCCLLFTYNNNNQINFYSIITQDFPLKKNVCRIKNIKGKWLMQDKGNGVLNISYSISTEKSKKVPSWISDPIVRNNMVATMKSFKNILENE